MITLQTHTEQETEMLGQAIATCLVPPANLLLVGELGSGKTVLARGIFAGLGADPSLVRSPTFSLINEYSANCGTVFHIDLYRLDEPSDFVSLPLEDVLSEDSIAVVEWANKLPCSVATSFHIQIKAGEGSHRFSIDPRIPGIKESTASFTPG